MKSKSVCDKKTFDNCTVAELKDIAKGIDNCKGYSNKKKDELVKLIKKCRKSGSNRKASGSNRKASGSNRKASGSNRTSVRKSKVKVKVKDKDVCNKKTLDNCKIVELKDIAKKSKCSGYSNKKKDELVKLIKKCMKTPGSGSSRKASGSSTRKIKVKSNGCNKKTLDNCKVTELKDIAKSIDNCKGYSNKKKDELVKLIKKCRKTSGSRSIRKASRSSRKASGSSPRKIKVKSNVCNKKTLDNCKVTELKDIAKSIDNCKGYSNKKKDELVKLIKKCRKASGSSRKASGSSRKASGSSRKGPGSSRRKNKKSKKNSECDINNLKKCSITELKAIAKNEGCKGYSKYNKNEIKLLINFIKNCTKPKSSNKNLTPDIFDPKFQIGDFVIYKGEKGKIGAIYKPIKNPFGIKDSKNEQYRYNLYVNHKLIKEKALENELSLLKS